jgi:hypothetical protein
MTASDFGGGVVPPTVSDLEKGVARSSELNRICGAARVFPSLEADGLSV